MKDAIKDLNFLTLITDTSTRKYKAILPVLVRGFSDTDGVKIFKLSVNLVTNEKSETIGNSMMSTSTNWNIVDKIVGFGADNCNTNFGGVHRNGQNNVFNRLKQLLKHGLVGIGCSAHIIHNAFDAACDQLPFQLEALVVSIYKHFHIYTLKVETLKGFCDDYETNFSMLVNHSSTRFLSLHPAIKKVTLYQHS